MYMDLFGDRGRIALDTRDLEFAARAAQAAHESEQLEHVAESKSSDRLVTSPLSAIPNRELEWLWPGYFPLGKCVLLVGDPGLGKSMLTCDLSAPVSAGRTWPDGAQPVVRGDVLMLTAEDGVDDTVKPRVRAAGGDLDAVHVLTAVRTNGGEERSFTLDIDAELLTYDLDARAARGRPVRLVTLDPLVAFMGAVDTHVDAVVRRALTPLARLADDFRVTVLCVMHLNKSVQINAIYRTGGSIAFVAQARAVFAVTRDMVPGSKARLLLPIKMNLAPEPPALRFLPGGTPPALEWDAEPVGEVDLEAALRGHHDDDHDDRPATQLERATDFLRAELRAGPRESEELLGAAREQGISKRTLERAKSMLGVKSDRDGFGPEGHWYWSLP
jgi:putative DNA primase/helicase